VGSREPRVFVTAEWRYLAMLNYAVDPASLAPFVPAGTELDFFEGRTFVSLVAFRFLQTRVLGVSVPFHADFEEVNLRFYVRRRAAEGWRRGVTFIRELVPRRAVALVARLVFNENYIAIPMSHQIADVGLGAERRLCAEYGWRHHGTTGSIRMRAGGTPVRPQTGSLEQFITEHYWGYVRQRAGGTLEYEVRHDPWGVWASDEAAFVDEGSGLFDPALSSALGRKPDSAFLADGSPVRLFEGRRIA